MDTGTMKVIVCGGRNFRDWAMLKEALDTLNATTSFDCVITGAAPGADTLADTWARSKGIRVERYYALWKTYGKAAGPIRNQKMLDDEHPDLVVAFPGGVGTADMVCKATAANITVQQIK
jgi:YspA, cpYpsA-related SLOG family